MVVISVKRADGDGFLFEATTDTKNEDLIASLVSIHNLRLRSRIVVDAVRDLARHGPMKRQTVVDAGHCADSAADPTGARTGNAPDPDATETLLRTAQDLEEYVDKAQVQRRVAVTEDEIGNKLSNVRGAVLKAYPEGLPEWDLVKVALDSVDGLKGTHVANDILESEDTSLWVAGKEFERGKLVSDRLGKNEKTKVVAKLQRRGDGPPSREPAVNEEERKAMMAHYFKRQEELKKLAESEDDDYLNSAWADPKEMKRNLQGLNDVRAPGLRF